MPNSVRIALIGDFNASVTAHRAIPEALRLAAAEIDQPLEGVWLHTSTLTDIAANLAGFSAVWCVPASPYANTDGALEAIRYARERGVPFLGTCGGFQHALLEYARHHCGLHTAEHEELAPGAELPLISRLSCSLVEATGEIVFREGSRLHQAYGFDRVTEGYHCNYGLNHRHAGRLFQDLLQPTAHDTAGEIRGVELGSHPFFVATLFQPERRALRGEVPPIVRAFVAAARQAPLDSHGL